MPDGGADQRRKAAYAILYDDGLAELAEDTLRGWPKSFVLDMADRFDRYGDDTLVSDNQLDKLQELAKEYL